MNENNVNCLNIAQNSLYDSFAYIQNYVSYWNNHSNLPNSTESIGIKGLIKAQEFLKQHMDKGYLYLPSEKEIKKMDMDCKTKMLYIDNAVVAFKNQSFYKIIPRIVDVKIYNEACVEVVFADGTSEKATLCESDNFSLEQGISICLTKKIISMKADGNGSSIYNKLIKYALRVYKKNREDEMKDFLETERIEAKRKKLKEKSAAKRAKRLQAQREEQIEIQKEAYLRAMRELNG